MQQGGLPDISTVARMVLNDWQRGKIPYYVRPPDSPVRTCTILMYITSALMLLEVSKCPLCLAQGCHL